MEREKAIRIGIPLAWLAGTVAMLLATGVPTSHDMLLIWLGLGMAAFTASDARRRLPRLLVDWAPFAAILLVYDLLRGVADGLVFHAHELPQLHADTWLFGKPIPTVWLQAHLWHGPNHLEWWDYVAWCIYLSHFLAALTIAAVLWTWAHERFAPFATMVCGLALAGFVTYVIYPAVPPWMAAQNGNLGQSNRIVPVVWRHVPIAHFNVIFDHGVRYANNVAAMPSLHAGYSVLVTLYLWRLSPRWVRPLLALYPPAMGFALVYTGEHYVVDVLAGWVYAAVTYAVVSWYFARRRGSVSERELLRTIEPDAEPLPVPAD